MSGSYKGLRKSRANAKRSQYKPLLSYKESADRIIKVDRKDPETGITISEDIRLGIVKPATAYMPTREDVNIYNYVTGISIIQKALAEFSGLLAVDIETKGTQAADSDSRIVGIGIASATCISYFDFDTNTQEVNQEVLNFLAEYSEGLVGHNVFFDGAFLYRYTGKWLDWRYDTYGLYKQLATEGYPGQSWALKSAQLQLLNWDHKGDVELDAYLIKNGYFTDSKKKPTAGYYPGPAGEDGSPRYYKPSKGDMYRAPAEILGFYCCLDAASTYQLFAEVFVPSIEGAAYEEVFWEYHDTFMTNVKMLAEQQLSGITIDREMLLNHDRVLTEELGQTFGNFINHPDVRPYADQMNQEAIDAVLATEPEKYKKLPKLSKEPAKLKKNGEVSKNWLQWDARRQMIEDLGPGEISKNWLSWQDRVENAKSQEHLNINSSDQLAKLFYDYLSFPIIIRTESGKPSTGASALPGLGELGKMLKNNKDLEKEHGYVRACIEHLYEDSRGDFRIHPQFRVPGTLTCRLAGSGGLNLQQIPKSRRYLDCWRPRPGKVWIDCDHTALEQVVLAELSRDRSLYKLYGPGARPNDVYIFNGAIMARDFGVKLFQPFLDAGYDPDNPDATVIKQIKKQYKDLRGLSKTASLGKSYGMGWAKFQLNMKLAGIEMGEYECRGVINGLDKVYAGTKIYEQQLLKEYDKNNGWVLNGIGRPVCCARDYLKDIVNRVVQSTGHDIHIMYVKILDDLFRQHNVNVDGIVWDFHDQSIVECDEKDAELVYDLIGRVAYDILNEQYLQGEIPLKGDPQYIETMSGAKCE